MKINTFITMLKDRIPMKMEVNEKQFLVIQRICFEQGVFWADDTSVSFKLGLSESYMYIGGSMDGYTMQYGGTLETFHTRPLRRINLSDEFNGELWGKKEIKAVLKELEGFKI